MEDTFQTYTKTQNNNNISRKFLRQNAIVAGVAGGIAERFDLPTALVRLILFVSFFTSFGITLVLYFTAAISFTSRKRFEAYGEMPKVLGVCYSLAPTIGIDLGWMRFFLLLASVFTGFFPVPFFYFVSYFLIKKN
jgi:phage shock protein PspC (stress-responsive transcriptional regulator)